MDKTVKILLLSTVLVLILVGGGIGALVINNRMATEREAKAQEQRREEREETEQKERAQKLVEQAILDGCLQRAEEAYWSYVKLNATSTRQTPDGPVYTAYQNTWDHAETLRKNAKDECHRR